VINLSLSLSPSLSLSRQPRRPARLPGGRQHLHTSSSPCACVLYAWNRLLKFLRTRLAARLLGVTRLSLYVRFVRRAGTREQREAEMCLHEITLDRSDIRTALVNSWIIAVKIEPLAGALMNLARIEREENFRETATRRGTRA